MKQLVASVSVFVLGVFAPISPALALSCMPHILNNVYNDVAESEDTYIVVHGMLTFDESLAPKGYVESQIDANPDTRIPARMVGQSLSKTGFDTPFDKTITLNLHCFGPWCGGGKSGIPYLGFLKRTKDGYELSLDPCGGNGFGKPSQEQLDQTVTCFTGGDCPRIKAMP